jgi:hypothetical protein
VALEERLREALRRSSSVVAPDVRRNLTTVRRRTRVVVIRGRIVNALVAAAVVGAVVWVGPLVFDMIRNQHATPATNPPSRSLVPRGELAGAYRVDLSGAGGTLAKANLDGPWTLALHGDSSIVWNAPAGSGVSEALPRDTYRISGSTMVTNLFVRSLCQGTGVGMYTWSRSGGTLRFETQRDACALRRLVLTTTPWTSG